MSTIIDRARNGEVFKDDGNRFVRDLLAHLKDKGGKPSDRGIGIYHPSSLTRCIRRLWYCRSGYPMNEGNFTPMLRMIFDTGHAVHDQLGKYVEEMYGLSTAVCEFPVLYEPLMIGGNADLVLFRKEDGSVLRVIDFKTIGKGGFAKLSMPRVDEHGNVTPIKYKDYVWQLHAYMAALDCDQSSLFFYCKDNSSLREYPVPFNFALWEKIEERLIPLEIAVADGEPPIVKASKVNCPTCPYYNNPCKPGV